MVSPLPFKSFSDLTTQKVNYRFKKNKLQRDLPEKVTKARKRNLFALLILPEVTKPHPLHVAALFF